MAIQEGYKDVPIVRQRLVAFQATIDLMNRFPHPARVHSGVHNTHCFGVGHRLAQPTLPEPGGTGHLQSVEASAVESDLLVDPECAVAGALCEDGDRAGQRISLVDQLRVLRSLTARNRSAMRPVA